MPALAQFLSPTITKLELISNGHLIGNATGFFMKMGDRWALVTNWHVLSGRDPVDGQPRHKSGAIPDLCRYFIFELVEEGIRTSMKTTPLGDALSGSATWLHHPTEGQSVDIGVLPLADQNVGLAKDIYGEAVRDRDAATKIVKYATALERLLMTEERQRISRTVSIRASRILLGSPGNGEPARSL